jgi:hypothetical protein
VPEAQRNLRYPPPPAGVPEPPRHLRDWLSEPPKKGGPARIKPPCRTPARASSGPSDPQFGRSGPPPRLGRRPLDPGPGPGSCSDSSLVRSGAFGRGDLQRLGQGCSDRGPLAAEIPDPRTLGRTPGCAPSGTPTEAPGFLERPDSPRHVQRNATSSRSVEYAGPGSTIRRESHGGPAPLAFPRSRTEDLVSNPGPTRWSSASIRGPSRGYTPAPDAGRDYRRRTHR